MAARHLGSIFEASGGIAIAAGGGVGQPNLEDPGNYESNPPEPLQLKAAWGNTFHSTPLGCHIKLNITKVRGMPERDISSLGAMG